MTTENHLNSSICRHLKNLIARLSHDATSQISRHLLEAIFVALAKGEKHEKLAKRIRGERYRKSFSTISLSIEKAKEEIAEIKRLRKFYHNTPLIPGAKKLERYHAEIVSLHRAGASLQEIKFWLLSHKKLIVSHHSVQRYIHAILNHEKTNNHPKKSVKGHARFSIREQAEKYVDARANRGKSKSSGATFRSDRTVLRYQDDLARAAEEIQKKYRVTKLKDITEIQAQDYLHQRLQEKIGVRTVQGYAKALALLPQVKI